MKTCTAHCSVWQEPVWRRRLVVLSMSVLPFPGTSWDYRIVQNLTKQECQWNTVHLELQTTVIRHTSKSQRRFKHPNVWDYHAGSKSLVALRIRIPCHQCLALKTAPQMLGLSHIKTFRDIEHELETSSMGLQRRYRNNFMTIPDICWVPSLQKNGRTCVVLRRQSATLLPALGMCKHLALQWGHVVTQYLACAYPL